jgi:hypothetical protein
LPLHAFAFACLCMPLQLHDTIELFDESPLFSSKPRQINSSKSIHRNHMPTSDSSLTSLC